MLNKYKKQGIIVIGSDNVELDSPEFKVRSIFVDMDKRELSVEMMHFVKQLSLEQKHSRNTKVDFISLPASVKTKGLEFFIAIDEEMRKLPQYSGAEKI